VAVGFVLASCRRKIAFMTEFEIVTAPVGGYRQADIFAAHWADILLATSHTPFFDSARKLLELGAEPNDVLIMRRRSCNTTSLRARVSEQPCLRSMRPILALAMFNGGIWVRSGARAPRSTADLAPLLVRASGNAQQIETGLS
jgi:hypothetical protein